MINVFEGGSRFHCTLSHHAFRAEIELILIE